MPWEQQNRNQMKQLFYVTIAQAQATLNNLQAAQPNVARQDAKKGKKLDDQINKLGRGLLRRQNLRVRKEQVRVLRMFSMTARELKTGF
jgi:hypothetical protein